MFNHYYYFSYFYFLLFNYLAGISIAISQPPILCCSFFFFLLPFLILRREADGGYRNGFRPSVSQSLPKNRHLLATLNSRNQLRNKPHLHIKRANKLKMRFIPLKLKETC